LEGQLDEALKKNDNLTIQVENLQKDLENVEEELRK
jgi:hypothetical protein